MAICVFGKKSRTRPHGRDRAKGQRTGEPVRFCGWENSPPLPSKLTCPHWHRCSRLGISSTGLARRVLGAREHKAAARADDGQRRDVKYPASERARRGGESASRGGTRTTKGPGLARDAARGEFPLGRQKATSAGGLGGCASRGEDGDARPRGARPRVGRARRRGREIPCGPCGGGRACATGRDGDGDDRGRSRVRSKSGDARVSVRARGGLTRRRRRARVGASRLAFGGWDVLASPHTCHVMRLASPERCKAILTGTRDVPRRHGSNRCFVLCHDRKVRPSITSVVP